MVVSVRVLVCTACALLDLFSAKLNIWIESPPKSPLLLITNWVLQHEIFFPGVNAFRFVLLVFIPGHFTGNAA